MTLFKGLFENNRLIKSRKSFWVSPFFKKAASFEAFWKKLHQKLLLFHDLIGFTFSKSVSKRGGPRDSFRCRAMPHGRPQYLGNHHAYPPPCAVPVMYRRAGRMHGAGPAPCAVAQRPVRIAPDRVRHAVHATGRDRGGGIRSGFAAMKACLKKAIQITD